MTMQREGSPSPAREQRPRSKVEQMLTAYYDIEEHHTVLDLLSQDSVNKKPPQTHPTLSRAGKPSVSNGDLTCERQHVALHTVKGGALRTALQLLGDIPSIQSSVASAIGAPGRGCRVVPQEPPVPPVLDLDSSEFDVHTFFSDALQRLSLRELLQLSNRLDSEVRTLEREVQSLVYDNYGKYLSASDSVRRVQDAMPLVEAQLQQLAVAATAIEEKGGGLMSLIQERASSIEDLVAFRQLMQQLQQLSTLPQLLRQHLAANDPEAALLVYRHVREFLQQQQQSCPHLTRLSLLFIDAEEASKLARRLLRQRLDPERSGDKRDAQDKGDKNSQLEDQQFIHCSKDASRILRLLLLCGEGARQMQVLYQGNRSRALEHLLEQQINSHTAARCKTMTVAMSSTSPCAHTRTPVKENMSEMFVAACRSVAEPVGELLCTAALDYLLLVTLISHEAQAVSQQHLEEYCTALGTKPITQIPSQGLESLRSSLSSLISLITPFLCSLLSAMQPSASAIVAGAFCIVKKVDDLAGVLPDCLREFTAVEAQALRRNICARATSLWFGVVYKNVAAGLASTLQIARTATSAAISSAGEGAAALPLSYPSLSSSLLCDILQRQEILQCSTVVDGCCDALEQLRELLSGVCSSQEAELVFREQAMIWVQGLFFMLERAAEIVTADSPATTMGDSDASRDLDEGATANEFKFRFEHTPSIAQNRTEDFPEDVNAGLESHLSFIFSPYVSSVAPIVPSFPLFASPLLSLLLLRVFYGLLRQGLHEIESRGTQQFPWLKCDWLGACTVCRETKSPAFSGLNPTLTREETGRNGSTATRIYRAAQWLMSAYVFICGQAAAEAVVVSLSSKDWFVGPPGVTGATDMVPSEITCAFSGILTMMKRCDADVSLALYESTRNLRGGAKGLPGHYSGIAGSLTINKSSRSGIRGQCRQRTVLEKEMERLFARKQPIFHMMGLCRSNMLIGVFRVSVRAVLEFIRHQQALDVTAVQQLQLEAAFTAGKAREFISGEEASVVDGFLDEVVSSAALRCYGGCNKVGASSGVLLTDAQVDSLLCKCKCIPSLDAPSLSTKPDNGAAVRGVEDVL